MATQHVMSGEAVDGGGADGAYVGDAADTDVDTVETHAIKRQRLLVTAEGQPSTARCCSTERREEGVASAAAPRGDAADAESTTIAPSLYWAGAQRRLWRSGSARENLDGPFPERPGPAQQSRDSQWLPSFNETNLQRALRIGGGGNSGRAGDDGEDGRTGERLASMRGQGTPHAHPHYNSDGSMPRDPPPDARGGSGGGGSTRRDGDGEGDGDVEMGVGLGTADDSGTVQGTSANNTDAAATTPTTTSTRLDLQLAMRWLEQALPFSLLLMLVFLQQHWLGLMTFASSTLLLCRVNDVVKRQVALREGRRAATLALTALSLLLFLCVMLPLPVPAGALWRQLLLLPPPRVPTFWEAVRSLPAQRLPLDCHPRIGSDAFYTSMLVSHPFSVSACCAASSQGGKRVESRRCLSYALKRESLARETPSEADVTIHSWSRNASTARWSSKHRHYTHTDTTPLQFGIITRRRVPCAY
jgi:hypothetical protein